MPRPTAKGGAKPSKAGGKKSKGARKPGYKRPMQAETEEEERIGYEKHHAAEIEEEGRRHFNADAETEARRDDEIEAKDRLERIDFDEDGKKRKRRRDEEEDDEDGEAAAEAAEAAKAAGLTAKDGAGKYFQDMPEDRMGDISLTDPNAMKRLLGPSVRFAQHAMLLTQRKLTEGSTRNEAIGYLAELYVGLDDRAYAHKALKDFGPATGILDIYPLEVFDHLLQNVPGFFTHVEKASFFAETTQDALHCEVGKVFQLNYDSELRVRGFAIRDGQRPGYLFEPDEEPGSYRLVWLNDGTFDVLMSAISKDGKVLIEELKFVVAPATSDTTLPAAIEREIEHDDDKPAKEEKEKPQDDLTVHFPRRI